MNQRYQQRRRALGSEAVLTMVAVQGDPRAEALLARLWQMIDSFEQRFSRFRADSELNRLNRESGRRVTVSPEMIDILQTAKSYAMDSDGLFNPLILSDLQRAGYLASFEPGEHPVDSAIDFTDRQPQAPAEIEIGDGWVKIPANTAIDLGGIGKGYLLDRLGQYLDSHGVADWWLSLGGDILANGRDLNAPGWPIAVAAAQAGGDAAAFSTGGRRLAVATSGTTKRRGGSAGGQAWHHLIDPRIGLPAKTDVLSATVAAESGTAADVLAKCLVINGSAQAQSFAAAHHITNAYLQLSPPAFDLQIGRLIRRT